MALSVPSSMMRTPLRRWISKSEGTGSEVSVSSEGGSLFSHRTERSQASTRGTLDAGIGGWEIEIVEMA